MDGAYAPGYSCNRLATFFNQILTGAPIKYVLILTSWKDTEETVHIDKNGCTILKHYAHAVQEMQRSAGQLITNVTADNAIDTKSFYNFGNVQFRQSST